METYGYSGTFLISQMIILIVQYIWAKWHSSEPSAYSDSFYRCPEGVAVTAYVCPAVTGPHNMQPSPVVTEHW